MVNIPKTEEHIIPGSVVKNNWYKYFKDLEYSLRPSQSGSGQGSKRTQFWQGVTDGYPRPVSFFRMRERVFIGDYANDSGVRSGGSGAWVATLDGGGGAMYPSYVNRDASLSVASPNGSIAIAGATRVSDATPVVASSIALGGVIVNDGSVTSGWGGIIEGQHEAGAWWTTGWEIVIKNKDVDINNTPYAFGGGTYGMWLVGGGPPIYGGDATFPSAVALGIEGRNDILSTRCWNVGIEFSKTSITGTDGTTGTGKAITMAKGHTIQWYGPSSVLGGSIRSDVNSSASDILQTFENGFVTWYSTTVKGIFRARHTASGVNFIEVRNAATGNPAQVLATGADTDIGIQIVPKGAGVATVSAGLRVETGLSIPAGGTALRGLTFGSGQALGIFFGSGAPSLSSAQGSLYLRSDGTGTTDRAYINTNGGTTWTALTTVA